MKLEGYLKGTGKLGNMVTSRVAGVTIARDYNPNVANPNTVAQMNQRARMKLASQLAAALAPVIAIAKEGLVSSRNLFIKKNMDSIIANNGEAQVTYENIQLTNGNTGLPAITATREAGTSITVQLAESADAAVSRVVYVVYRKTNENILQFVGSAVQDEAGDDGLFPVQFADINGDVIIWAYGMKDRSTSASVKYGSYNVNTGEDIARLWMNRTLSASDYQTTVTRGVTLFADAEGTVSAGENQNLVFITASGPGTVAGTGFTGNRKAVTAGESCTVTATPNDGSQFDGWKLNGTDTLVSSEASYTFTPTQQTDLVAYFSTPGSSNDNSGDGELGGL